MAGIDRDEFITHMQLLHKGQDGIIAHLDVLNGRTRENEKAIAVLQARATVQEDRPTGTHTVGAIVGGGISAIVIGAAELAKWWFAK